jgi:hypothetical protein
MGVGKVGAEVVRRMAGKLYGVECRVVEEVTAGIGNNALAKSLYRVIARNEVTKQSVYFYQVASFEIASLRSQ